MAGYIAGYVMRIILHFARNPVIQHHAGQVLREVAKVTFKHATHYYTSHSRNRKI